MASRALAKVATSPDDYVKVYADVLDQCDKPVILHWLGDMFDPSLKGYWGSEEFEPALQTALSIINQNIDKIDGIKISLLDKDKEISMRRRLPDGVRMYTGDDFNFAELIAGDDQGYSDALLGIFDVIAPAAAPGAAAAPSPATAAVRTNSLLFIDLSRTLSVSDPEHRSGRDVSRDGRDRAPALRYAGSSRAAVHPPRP